MKVIPVKKKEFLSNFLSKGIPVPFWAHKKGTGKRNMHPRYQIWKLMLWDINPIISVAKLVI